MKFFKPFATIFGIGYVASKCIQQNKEEFCKKISEDYSNCELPYQHYLDLDKERGKIAIKIFDTKQEIIFNNERSDKMIKKEIRHLENKLSDIKEKQANIPECIKKCIKNNVKKSEMYKLKKECFDEHSMESCEEYRRKYKEINNDFENYINIKKNEDQKDIYDFL